MIYNMRFQHKSMHFHLKLLIHAKKSHHHTTQSKTPSDMLLEPVIRFRNCELGQFYNIHHNIPVTIHLQLGYVINKLLWCRCI